MNRQYYLYHPVFNGNHFVKIVVEKVVIKKDTLEIIPCKETQEITEVLSRIVELTGFDPYYVALHAEGLLKVYEAHGEDEIWAKFRVNKEGEE